LPLKNKTNQLLFSFICCRLGRSIIEKERKEKAREKNKGKTKKIHKKTLQTYKV
jgi:hypothetical protein